MFILTRAFARWCPQLLHDWEFWAHHVMMGCILAVPLTGRSFLWASPHTMLAELTNVPLNMFYTMKDLQVAGPSASYRATSALGFSRRYPVPSNPSAAFSVACCTQRPLLHVAAGCSNRVLLWAGLPRLLMGAAARVTPA
jgi:hypothetical protein